MYICVWMYVCLCIYHTSGLWELVSEALPLSSEQARGCGRPPRRARQGGEEEEEEEEEKERRLRKRRRSGRLVAVVKVA